MNKQQTVEEIAEALGVTRQIVRGCVALLDAEFPTRDERARGYAMRNPTVLATVINLAGRMVAESKNAAEAA